MVFEGGVRLVVCLDVGKEARAGSSYKLQATNEASARSALTSKEAAAADSQEWQRTAQTYVVRYGFTAFLVYSVQP
jgi:hypothetical protein